MEMYRRLTVLTTFLFFVYCSCLSEVLNAQTTLAVIDLVGQNVNKSIADTLTQKLRYELSRVGTINVMKRQLMVSIFLDQGFEQVGCFAPLCLIETGILLQVQKVVGGTVRKKGNGYLASIKSVNVDSVKIEKQIYFFFEDIGSKETMVALQNAANELIGIPKMLASEQDTSDVRRISFLAKVGYADSDYRPGLSWGFLGSYTWRSIGTVGIDFTVVWINSVNVFVVYEKQIWWFLMQTGLGFVSDRYPPTGSQNENKKLIAQSFGLRLGIGRQFLLTKRLILATKFEYNLGFKKFASNVGTNVSFGVVF